jgi:hypothetical protein
MTTDSDGEKQWLRAPLSSASLSTANGQVSYDGEPSPVFYTGRARDTSALVLNGEGIVISAPHATFALILV